MISLLLELISYVLVDIIFNIVFHRVGQATIFLISLGKFSISTDEYNEWVIVIGFLVCALPVVILVFRI